MLSVETIRRRLKEAKARKLKRVTNELMPQHKTDRIVWCLDARLWIKKTTAFWVYAALGWMHGVFEPKQKDYLAVFWGEQVRLQIAGLRTLPTRSCELCCRGVISALSCGVFVTVRGNLNSAGHRDLLAESLVPLLGEIGHESSFNRIMLQCTKQIWC